MCRTHKSNSTIDLSSAVINSAVVRSQWLITNILPRQISARWVDFSDKLTLWITPMSHQFMHLYINLCYVSVPHRSIVDQSWPRIAVFILIDLVFIWPMQNVTTINKPSNPEDQNTFKHNNNRLMRNESCHYLRWVYRVCSPPLFFIVLLGEHHPTASSCQIWHEQNDYRRWD